MIRTLYGKLSVALVAIVLAIATLYAVLTLFATRHHLQVTEQRLNRHLARDLVADRNLVEEGRINETALKEMFHDYMTINPSIEIYLIDLQGNILSFSADPGVVKRNRVSLEPVRAFLAGDDAYPLLGDDPRSHDGRKAFSVTAVPSDEDPEGYLYVVLLGERVDTIAALLHTSFIARYSGLALIVSVVVGALAGLVVLRAITRRLRRLTNHIDRFRARGFRTFEPFATPTGGPGEGDEISQLGHAYDEMAARIGEQLDALEKTDALRREMVAHVSHDLRTPLATLHGYIETLKLKDTELESAERRRYLAVALDQSERLRRLVGDLFELAKLDAHEQMPACEPVSIGELVSDIAQKFQLEAQRCGTSIEIDTGEGLPMVNADIALVERVLENLIENALSHSRSPNGGSIRIPITSSGHSVRVTVSDSGPGIAPEHLPRVFDRFYQAGNAHRGNAHAGLGLAIAKRIVELHGARLEVESTLGQGTAFSFRLPAHVPATPASAT